MLLDCGASECMTGDRCHLVSRMEPAKLTITSVDKASVLTTAGQAAARLYVAGGVLEVPTMYFVPGMEFTFTLDSSNDTTDASPVSG